MTGNEPEVLVIGEGLSGITAAAAAQSQGSHVTLVSTGPGTFILGTASLDLRGLDAAEVRFSEHGPQTIQEAITFFLELTASAGCAYEGSVRERRLVPTIMGTFQEVSLAPVSLWKGDPRSVEKAVIVGIENMSGFDPNFVAERLSLHSKQMGYSTSYRGVTVQALENDKHALTTTEIATRLDRDPGYRAAVVAAFTPAIKDAQLLIIPGILGMNSDDDDIRRFEDDIGCAVCELATLPPSVPGLRLLRRLERRLAELGVDVCTGFSVQKLCMEGDRCTGAVLDTPGRPRTIYADAVILAAGRFSQLLDDDSPDMKTSRRASSFNRELQPVNNDGLVMATNVFECGSILRKFESRHGNAIAVVTGYHAAMQANERGVHYAGR